MVERTLAAPDPAEIEAQHRKPAMHKGVVALVDDLVVHGAGELRMRVQHHRDRRILLLCRMIAAFEAARGAGENDFGHCWSLAKSTGSSGSRQMNAALWRAGRAPLGLDKRTALGELEAAF